VGDLDRGAPRWKLWRDLLYLRAHAALYDACMRISYKAACPQCGSADYRRSKRRGILERFALSLVKLLPYRCDECNARFYNRLEPSHARR